MKKLVALVMGSKSDWPIMEQASMTLDTLGIPHEARALSAHRTLEALCAYIKSSEQQGIEIIIAGAGGAAHLPGVVAAQTILPVLGVPMPSSALSGMDSLLSIVQMPSGIPVATFSIGKSGAVNAALFAVSILARKEPAYAEALKNYREKQEQAVLADSVLKN